MKVNSCTTSVGVGGGTERDVGGAVGDEELQAERTTRKNVTKR
jgi:hypothetical protein